MTFPSTWDGFGEGKARPPPPPKAPLQPGAGSAWRENREKPKPWLVQCLQPSSSVLAPAHQEQTWNSTEIQIKPKPNSLTLEFRTLSAGSMLRSLLVPAHAGASPPPRTERFPLPSFLPQQSCTRQASPSSNSTRPGAFHLPFPSIHMHELQPHEEQGLPPPTPPVFPAQKPAGLSKDVFHRKRPNQGQKSSSSTGTFVLFISFKCH